MTEIDELLAEQREYYRERAPEYDDWWNRRRRWDLGREGNQRWEAEIALLQDALDAALPKAGDVVELAVGTGNWTLWLAERYDSILAIDASSEMMAINARRLEGAGRGERVRFERADLFAWEPRPAAFDVIFFAFWLSHVPESRTASFLTQVSAALRPGGVVAIVDNRRDAISTSSGRRDGERMIRTLSDGREFTIVKRFDEPEDLIRRLEGVGLQAEADTTGEHFLYALGRRS